MDVRRILTEYQIPFITSGKNVASGNVNIKCPFCGTADKSEHLGINLATGYWGCWRDATHRGTDFAKLLNYLLPISYSEAKSIVSSPPSTETLQNLINQVNSEVDTKILADAITLPKNFYTISESNSFSQPFVTYLKKRGFEKIDNLVSRFPLYFCLSGEFKHRIIFPFYVQHQLRAWSGRTILNSPFRYRSFPAGKAIKQSLFCFDYLNSGGRNLYLVEGPFDALKVNYFSKYDKAVPILGTSISSEQLNLLVSIHHKFSKICLLLDKDAFHQAFSLLSQLSIFNPVLCKLPDGVKDPGDLTSRQILSLEN